jgi:hypothetical protein
MVIFFLSTSPSPCSLKSNERRVCVLRPVWCAPQTIQCYDREYKENGDFHRNVLYDGNVVVFLRRSTSTRAT